MKMRSGIIQFICAAMCLTTPVTYATGNYLTDLNRVNSEISDTSVIRVDSFNLSILPPSSGIQYYRDGIVFLSSSKSEGKMLADHLSFGKIDARYAVLNDLTLENHLLFSPSAAFTYPAEAVTFSSDYNTMYFTKNSSDGEKIYKAIYTPGTGNQGDWTIDANPVSFCSDKSTYTHPALSANGKMIVFASDRAGSVGGMDLFVSLEKGGAWSDPVNLGDAVNSTANELYPYLDSENNLFFSSDNLQGYGGYDIYVCKFKGNTWEKPINLSTPVNTRYDDVAFRIDRKDGKSAFYTVKQNSGKKSARLYKVSMNPDRSENLLNLSQFYTRPDISQMVILALEPAVQATDNISVTATSGSGEGNNIIYRVQFLTSFNPKTRSQINVEGKDYSVFEYLYSGAYRLCVGDFTTITPALELQSVLVKSDYPNASVVVFKNNVLSLDAELLKNQPVTGPVASAEQAAIAKPAVEAKPTGKVSANLNKETAKPEVKKSENVKAAVPVPETKKIAAVAAIPATTENKGAVVYRVQIFSGGTGGSTKVKVDNKTYNTYEYKYSGTYRTCIGEFSSLTPAKEFQNICRKSAYPQAFVVAFKDNVRSIDPVLFK
jgi:hypothetical protein